MNAINLPIVKTCFVHSCDMVMRHVRVQFWFNSGTLIYMYFSDPVSNREGSAICFGA